MFIILLMFKRRVKRAVNTGIKIHTISPMICEDFVISVEAQKKCPALRSRCRPITETFVQDRYMICVTCPKGNPVNPEFGFSSRIAQN
jgi:hypothetical protein